MTAQRAPDGEVGRFRLVKKLGEGGMGEVWAATHLQTRKSVALKLLKATETADPLQAKRFLREARAASAVRHPNVVQIHDVLELPNGEFAIVMDLLQGEDLSQLLERRGALPLGEVASLMHPVLEALSVAHAAGVVHRDLKPENIFLDQPVPGRIHPKVLDFGIAKLTAQSGPAEESMQLTRTGTVMGSPYYMSPEQVFGEADLDARSDLWSLGVILYEALAGQRPFVGENYGQLFKAITQGKYVALGVRAPHLPPAVLELVALLLQTDRTKRPGNLERALEVLGRYSGATESGVLGATGLFTVAASAPVDTEFTTGPTEVLPNAPLVPSTRSAPIQRTWFTLPKITAGRVAVGAALLATTASVAAWFGLEPKPATSSAASQPADTHNADPLARQAAGPLPSAVGEAAQSSAPTTLELSTVPGSPGEESPGTMRDAEHEPTSGGQSSGEGRRTAPSTGKSTRAVAPTTSEPVVGPAPSTATGTPTAAASTALAVSPAPSDALGSPSSPSSARLPGNVVSEAPF